ncbi:MAG: hypothetical protein SchgKO_23300 [Schleiferiaceae bacterium]
MSKTYRTSIVVIAFLLSSTSVWACCAESIYHLYPMGERGGSTVFLEISGGRNCKMMGRSESGEHLGEFYFRGVARWVEWTGDSLRGLDTVEVMSFTECQCSHKNHREKSQVGVEWQKVYDKAYAEASQWLDFTMAKRQSIAFNDSSNTVVIDSIVSDYFEMKVFYKDLITVDLGFEQIISCFPTHSAVVRNYATDHYQILVLRLRCTDLDAATQAEAQRAFEDPKSGPWMESAQWHGISKDYLRVDERE